MLNRLNAASRALARLGPQYVGELTSTSHEGDLLAEERVCLESLQKKGYLIVPGFIPEEACVGLRAEIDLLIGANIDACWQDDKQSDTRLFASNLLSEQIAGYFDHPMLTRVASTYLKTNTLCGYTLANRIAFRPDNRGSGGGFHRDNSRLRDFKAILYLSDVDETSGAFQYLEGSHRLKDRLSLILRDGPQWRGKRFEGQRETRYLERHEGLRTLTGDAGTLVLTDTTGIHRGRPVEKGCRYALTNYYWRNRDDVPDEMVKIASGITENPIRQPQFNVA